MYDLTLARFNHYNCQRIVSKNYSTESVGEDIIESGQKSCFEHTQEELVSMLE